jgi:hypothetical protein
MFFLNVGSLPTDYMALYSRGENLESNVSCSDLQKDLVVTLQEPSQSSLDAPSVLLVFLSTADGTDLLK